MSGERPSVRLPRRIVPICVSEPTGCDLPLRTSSTPAMNVVLTAPMPGSRTPSFPLAGAILEGFSMPLLFIERSKEKMNLGLETPQRKRAAHSNKQIIMRDAAKICKSERKESRHSGRRTGARQLKNRWAAVDVQDNRTLIWHYHEPPAEVKWDK